MSLDTFLFLIGTVVSFSLISFTIRIVSSTKASRNCPDCGNLIKNWDKERVRHPYCSNGHALKTVKGYLA
jgi:hypothetical protein